MKVKYALDFKKNIKAAKRMNHADFLYPVSPG